MAEMPVVLVTTKSEADIAADLKRRFEEAMKAVTAIMDEANEHGMMIAYDGIMRSPPFFKNTVLGLRVEKRY